MKIKIKTLRGKIYTLEVNNKNTIEDIKKLLEPILKLSKDLQKFVYKGKVLKNGTLLEWGIKDGDFFVIVPIISKNIRKEKLKENNLHKINSNIKYEQIKTSNSSVKNEILPSNLTSNNSSKISSQITEKVNELTSQLHNLVNSLGINLPSSTSNENSSTTIEDLMQVDNYSLQQMKDMGFKEEHAKKALLLNRMNVPQAMEWLLEHGDDPDIDTPLTVEQISKLNSFSPNSNSVQKLVDMGFDTNEVHKALRITNNNYEAAAAWLLGDRDLDEEDVEEITLDTSNPVIQSLLNNQQIQKALGNPRVLNALKMMIDDPSSASQYANDPEINPILLQVHNILQNSEKTENGNIENENIENENIENENIENEITENENIENEITENEVIDDWDYFEEDYEDDDK